MYEISYIPLGKYPHSTMFYCIARVIKTDI